jgi:hypothetical protein
MECVIFKDDPHFFLSRILFIDYVESVISILSGQTVPASASERSISIKKVVEGESLFAAPVLITGLKIPIQNITLMPASVHTPLRLVVADDVLSLQGLAARAHTHSVVP